MWMDNFVLNFPLEDWDGQENEKMLFRFFESKTTAVVLASSNDAEKEVNISYCESKKIPILRRKGGGGTVVLGPGCLILTFAFYAKDVFQNKTYFELINELWARALAERGVPKLYTSGISDLCYDNKKLAGTSIFRKKHLLVYQGSLLVNPNMNLIADLLKHPSKEPDYRNGRSHQSFLSSIHELGVKDSASDLAIHCSNYFKKNAAEFLRSHFLDSNKS